MALLALSGALLGETATAVAADGDAGRAYELVSPVDKGGQPVFFGPVLIGLTQASPEGDAAIFGSWGAFAGSGTGMPMQYRADRGPTGWTSRAVAARPSSPTPDAFNYPSVWARTTPDLRFGMYGTLDNQDPTDVNGVVDLYRVGLDRRPELISRGNGAERLVTTNVTPVALSDNGEHAVFTTSDHLVPEDVGRIPDVGDVYDRVDGTTRLVNQADGGGVVSRCGSQIGPITTRNAISPDGRRIIFSSPFGGADPACAEPQQVYVRVEHARTIRVSASQRSTPDPAGTLPAAYEGASDDSSLVFFSSSEMLVDGVATGGLYRYDTSSGDLVQFLSGELAASVVKISGDGSRVYFTSSSVIVGDEVPGEVNLYVASANGQIRRVAGDPSGFLLPGDLTGFETVRRAVVTPDGRHLLFATSARLTPFDNGGRYAVYLYDADAGQLTCVSCNPAGQRPDGAGVVSDASFRGGEEQDPPISADGEVVVFESGDQLTRDDVNARRDVYEYRDGRLSLVSTGRGQNDALLVGMSAGGRDVFFTTADSLVPEDVDGGNLDLYDARIGGGFPRASVVTPTPCVGDACQGRPTAPPASDDPATSDFRGEGNVEAPPIVRRSVSVSGLSSRARRALASGRRAVLAVRTRGGGSVRAVARARIGRRTRTVASGRTFIRARGAATARISLRLSRVARSELSDGKRLRVRLTVSIAGTSASDATSFTLTQERAR